MEHELIGESCYPISKLSPEELCGEVLAVLEVMARNEAPTAGTSIDLVVASLLSSAEAPWPLMFLESAKSIWALLVLRPLAQV